MYCDASGGTRVVIIDTDLACITGALSLPIDIDGAKPSVEGGLLLALSSITISHLSGPMHLTLHSYRTEEVL
jgi:hypothetical protein